MIFKISPTLHINNLTKKLIAEGKNVSKLGFGQSPFPVPEIVVEHLKKSAHIKDYLPSQGLSELRVSIAKYYTTQRNMNVDPDQIVVGPGSKELIFLTQMALRRTLLLPQPSWVSYAPQARMIGNKVEWLDCSNNINYKLKPEVLENALIKNKDALLILNYPNNPTGVSYTSSELENLAVTLRKSNAIVIADEIYSRLQFNFPFQSLSNYFQEGTIICSGLSKWCGAGGWRLGYMVFPKELDTLKATVIAYASETYSCAHAPTQYAAINAFGNDPSISEYLKRCNHTLKHVSTNLITSLEDLELNCTKSDGGFYTFVSFDNHKDYLSALGIHDSEQLCNYLLKEKHIALLPGSAFGFDKKKLIVRLAYVDFEGNKILQKQNLLNINFTISKDFPNISVFLSRLRHFLN